MTRAEFNHWYGKQDIYKKTGPTLQAWRQYLAQIEVKYQRDIAILNDVPDEEIATFVTTYTLLFG